MADTKTAVIVGASRGLGLGLAGEFLGRGWRVIGTVRDDEGERALRGLGDIRAERLDVADDAEVDAFAGRLAGQSLDLLFLNAGVMGTPDLLAASGAEAAQVMLANAIGPARLAARLADQVTSKTGVIGFMTSGMGSIADNTSGGYEIYRASKAAQNQFARSLWVKTAQPRGVTVLSVNPGWVQTDMGGAGASIDVPTSVRGIADQIEARAGSGEHAFVGWNGRILPW
jgi:NAD(P)-dependent dehydrogenase (short-subunit alcohol dehydrogenase family)